MQNIGIFSDWHITQSSLPECKEIGEEIINLFNANGVDSVVNLGDTFDNLKPTSQELDFYSDFQKKLNRSTIIIAAQSHESTSLENSILNHFGILDPNIKIVKEYNDDNYLFAGHFTLKESTVNYGSVRSKDEFKGFKYVLLGHQHSKQLIDNVCHLGSIRYVNFNEFNDQKKILIIQNYRLENEKCLFLALKSTIPMKVVSMGTSDLKLQAVSLYVEKSRQIQEYLDSLPSKTKVKVIIYDFESFRGLLPLVNRYSSKFTLFKYECKFDNIISVNNQKEKTELLSFKESFTNWLKKQKIDPKITEILQKEIE